MLEQVVLEYLAGAPNFFDRLSQSKILNPSEKPADGAGDDIRSFESDGRHRYIKVKTTGLAKAFPFYVSANEVACSRLLGGDYHLYRLFRFSRTPGPYVLSGSLQDTCKLDPAQFRARVE